MAVMKAADFVAKLIDVAKNYKTLYVMGCFGAPMNAANKTRYTKNHSYNMKAARTAMIKAASADTFGFDCVCLIKGILWGWNGNKNKSYGGATYASNGVPDIGADTMITRCTSVSTTGWANMLPGEAVWMSGHIGVYIGDGLAVECTPSWANKVQITAVGNIGAKSGYNTRKWTKHGRLPWINYTGVSTSTGAVTTTPTTSTTTAALKVGDVVDFIGTTHYSNASAKSGFKCKPGKATITSIYAKGTHPYHLKAVQGGGSTVYGWVDAKDISVGGQSAIKKVRVTATALNIRSGPGTNYSIVGCIRDKGTYTVDQISNGWGHISSGWISLSYTVDA